MKLLCLISYTRPEGRQFTAGELVDVEPELGLWLLSAAEGQFKLVEDGFDGPTAQDDQPLERPPASRQVVRPPLGGIPSSRKR